MWLTATSADLDVVWEASLEDSKHVFVELLIEAIYPHSGMKRSGNLIVLFQTRAATEDLWKPELTDGTFHVLNASLNGCRSANPLRGFAPNTTDHVGMSECLWCVLGRLCDQRGRHWLRDTGMEGGRSAGDDSHVNLLLASAGARGFAGCWSNEGIVVSERGSHNDGRVKDAVDSAMMYMSERLCRER